MILAVMAVRIFAVKWLPRWTLRLLWMAVLCRLLMPLRVPSPTSIYAAAERFGRMAGKPGLLLEGRGVHSGSCTQSWISPFILPWAAGTLLLAFYFVYCHIRSRRGYREALPLEHPFVKAWLSATDYAGRYGCGFPIKSVLRSPMAFCGRSFFCQRIWIGRIHAGWALSWHMKQRISVISTHWGNGCWLGGFVCIGLIPWSG